MKLCYLDFEFTNIVEAKLDLVSVASKCYDKGELTFSRTFWLYQNERNKNDAKKFFTNRINEGYIFVAYVMEAEARSLESLYGFMPEFKAIDLYLEYRCLLNHNHKLAYGLQYIEGEIIKTSPPKNKWEVTEGDDNDAHHKPSYSLAAATYKLLDVKIDTKEKDEVRNIIIRSNPDEINQSADRILKYNESDIDYLRQILNKVYNHHRRERGSSVESWVKEALKRGKYAVATAKMVILGYPINASSVKKFSSQTKEILQTAAQECMKSDPSLEPFRWNKKHGRYSANENNIRAWVEAQNKPYWRKTDKDKTSLSRDAFKDWYSSESEGFGGAYCRYLKTKQSLNGFLPGGKSKKFFEFVGSDNRVRPYFGIYGSQSSRSQPSASGFIPLKAHWMRIFLDAPEGKALCGIDYSSQEFLIAAILSQDSDMMAAYSTGDVYLAFAKSAGLAPKDATKATHKTVRDLCKALVLGISYDMSARGLAPRLSEVSKQVVSEDKAQGYIDLFYDAYPDYAEWKKDILEEYESSGYLELPDGWVMWGDNDNRRSVGNFPVQGHGAVIMREAVTLAQAKGLDVVFTLHDAIYIELPVTKLECVRVLMDCMQAAFKNIMSRYGRVIPVGLEGDVWSKYFVENSLQILPKSIHVMTEYVDDRGKKDLELYRKFL